VARIDAITGAAQAAARNARRVGRLVTAASRSGDLPNNDHLISITLIS
jgi:hypothetical protein